MAQAEEVTLGLPGAEGFKILWPGKACLKAEVVKQATDIERFQIRFGAGFLRKGETEAVTALAVPDYRQIGNQREIALGGTRCRTIGYKRVVRDGGICAYGEVAKRRAVMTGTGLEWAGGAHGSKIVEEALLR